MKQLLNNMRQHAQQAAQPGAETRTCIVTSYDPTTYSAKVMFQPEGVESGWLPVGASWVGNGWGMFCPPSPGDEVKVEFQEGSMSAGMIDARFFTDEERPLPVPSGEFWLVHKSGSKLKFTNDGNVELVAHQNLAVTVGGDMAAQVSGNVSLQVGGNINSQASNWNHNGKMNVTGDIAATGDVTAGSISLKNHLTTGVKAGGDLSGKPQ